jgi:hypothetical protein
MVLVCTDKEKGRDERRREGSRLPLLPWVLADVVRDGEVVEQEALVVAAHCEAVVIAQTKREDAEAEAAVLLVLPPLLSTASDSTVLKHVTQTA